MSFGSISYEAHSTLAIAMNRIGAKKQHWRRWRRRNSLSTQRKGENLRSRGLNKLASGRFGVTARYLYEADEIQIKMAQRCKTCRKADNYLAIKVDAWIGKPVTQLLPLVLIFRRHITIFIPSKI